MEIEIITLRRMCDRGAIVWTEHAALRMIKRGIKKTQVFAAIRTGIIIEQYPDDYPYPSCLVLGYDENGHALHLVCGFGMDKVWMITAYYPNPAEWETDLKTRKEPLA